MNIIELYSILPFIIFIMILPYVLLGCMIMIYYKYKSFYKRYKYIYFILLFFISIYVMITSIMNFIIYASDAPLIGNNIPQENTGGDTGGNLFIN